MLQSYTLEELLYEYHDKVERRKAEEASSEKEADRMEDEQIKANLDWAEEEERKELEAMKAKQAADEAQRKAEEQIALEEQMRLAKESIGEGFGDDIDTDFGDV